MPDSKKVFALMDSKGLTQAEVSRRSGIERSHLNHFLRRNESVNENTIVKLCRALECKPEDIMKGF